jgi:hypothetical protein
MTKVIVAGSREFRNYAFIRKHLEKLLPADVTEIVCGDAQGVDTAGNVYAWEHGIPVHHFPADWQQYPKDAGIRRNREMADHADMLIAFFNGSPGTDNMIAEMEKRRKKIEVVRLPQ